MSNPKSVGRPDYEDEGGLPKLERSRIRLPMTSFVDSLRHELSQLEAELQTDPRYAKITKIKELLDTYSAIRTSGGSRGETLSGSAARQTTVRRAAPTTNGDVSQAERIRREITKILSERGQTHRKEILAKVLEAGLLREVQNPLHRLAIHLSGNKNLFISDGAGNFRLVVPKESSETATPSHSQ